MRMDKLTTQFQQALADAQSLANRSDHQFLEPVHVMAALLEHRPDGRRRGTDSGGGGLYSLSSPDIVGSEQVECSDSHYSRGRLLSSCWM
jgi:hypothetical protein